MKVALSLAAVLLAVNLVRAIPSYPCVPGSYSEHETDIHMFYMCVFENWAVPMTCGEGTRWVQTELICNWEIPPQTAAPAVVVVPETAAPPAFVCTEDTYKGDDCDPTVFYQCEGTLPAAGKWTKIPCPAGTHWNQEEKKCLDKNDAYVKPAGCL